MISERERGIYQVFSLLQISCGVLLFAGIYLASLFREGWDPAPVAYLKCLAVFIAATMLEAATRPVDLRLNVGQASRRVSLVVAQRQTLWLLAGFGLLLLLSRDHRISRSFVLALALCAFPLFYWFNRRGRGWLLRTFKSGNLHWRMRTLVLGPKDWCESVRERLHGMGNVFDFTEVAVVSPETPFPELARRIEKRPIDLLVMPSRTFPDHTVIDLLGLGDRRGFRVWLPLELSRRYGRRFELQNVAGLSVLSPPSVPLANTFNRLLKRIFDLIFSGTVIATALLPLMIAVWLIQRRYSPGPLFFRQERVGENGRTFQIYKFRTMHVHNDDEARQASSNDDRVYTGARLLRRLSLDEFPQFLNVFRGEMSVIGPRPHMLSHEREFEEFHELYGSRRYVKPGVTGLAQVMGYRGEIKGPRDIRGRARYDLIYVRRWCITLDIRLVLMTVLQVVRPPKTAY